jgi:glycosyltransferase involved in cell wall biosynthesis
MREHNRIPKITALAITFNEEKNVKRYVEALSFTDEVIFIDSESTDNTVSLAQELGVKVIERKFTNLSEQINFAIKQAKNDWIVFFDFDEIISENLELEILASVKNPKSKVAFFVKRNFLFMGRRINFGGLGNDKTIRVFNKNFCNYDEKSVSEKILVQGKIGILKNKLSLYSYKSFDSYNEELSKTSLLAAQKLYAEKIKPNAFHLIIKPIYNFFKQYVFKLGIFDGKEGFILAYVHSFSVFKKYLLLWMMYRKIN